VPIGVIFPDVFLLLLFFQNKVFFKEILAQFLEHTNYVGKVRGENCSFFFLFCLFLLNIAAYLRGVKLEAKKIVLCTFNQAIY
jgi:hypothetical protein